MSGFFKGRPTRTAALAAAVGAGVWALLYCGLCAGTALDAVKFIAFQVAFIALPGLALFKLSGLRLTPLESLAASYGLGLIAVTAVYFVLAPFGLTKYIPFALAGVAVFFAAVLLKMKGRPLSFVGDAGECRIAVAFCVFAGLITFFILSLDYITPNLAGPRELFSDTMFSCSLTLGAARGFPMAFLELAGTVLYYHPMFYAYTSSMYLTTGIAAFEIVTKMSLVTIAPFFAATAVAFAKRVLKSNRLVVLASVLLLVIPTSYSTYFFYQDLLGFSLGLAFSLLALICFLNAWETERRPGRYWLFTVLFLAACTCAKGPIGVTILFGICFSLLLRLVRNKDTTVFLKGLMCAAASLGVYFAVYGSSASESMSFFPLFGTISSEFTQTLLGFLPRWLALAVGCVVYSVAKDGVFFISMAVMLTWTLCKKTKPNVLVDFSLGIFLLGYIFLNLLVQNGSSESYFLTSAQPVIIVMLIYCARELRGTFSTKQKKTAFTAVLLIALAPFVFIGARQSFYIVTGEHTKIHVGNYVFNSGLEGAMKYSRFNAVNDPERVRTVRADIADDDRECMLVTAGEYEAYTWIRDNTPEDAVIVDSRYDCHQRYCCGTVLSERASYLSGTAYTGGKFSALRGERDGMLGFMFADEDESFIPLLAVEGCDYMVFFKCVTGDWELSDAYAKEVFRNADAIVYEITFKA